jgi:hypothetical protein
VTGYPLHAVHAVDGRPPAVTLALRSGEDRERIDETAFGIEEHRDAPGFAHHLTLECVTRSTGKAMSKV